MITADLDLTRTRTLLQRGIEDRLHLGAQLYVALPDHVPVALAVGESRPLSPLRRGDLMLWLSACKPITAVAVMQLVEHGALKLEDPVAAHIPEFAQHGKDAITVRHLLTHTAGIRPAAANSNGVPWDEVIQSICASRPEPRWIPGETAGYHPSSSWYILGELIRRLSTLDYIEYLRERIFLPLGMNDSWIGMPPQRYHAYGSRIAPIYDTSGGTFEQEQFSNSEAGVVMPRPAGGGRGPIRELGRFYEMLRNRGSLNGARILTENAIAEMTRRHRDGKHDRTFNHVIDWGLGFILNSGEYDEGELPYGYGPYASRGTFGHSGNQSSCAFCDPEHGLVVAWACNGMPGEPAHQRRQRAVNAAIYEDLKLAR